MLQLVFSRARWVFTEDAAMEEHPETGLLELESLGSRTRSLWLSTTRREAGHKGKLSDIDEIGNRELPRTRRS
jgi:hypothetical protein